VWVVSSSPFFFTAVGISGIAVSGIIPAVITDLGGVGGRIDRRPVSFAVSVDAAGGTACGRHFSPSDVGGGGGL
jgi:hypothetical protein